MSKNKNRREQKPKNMGNRALNDAMQGKRSSNAAGPHRPKNAYVRKPKYGNRYDND